MPVDAASPSVRGSLPVDRKRAPAPVVRGAPTRHLTWLAAVLWGFVGVTGASAQVPSAPQVPPPTAGPVPEAVAPARPDPLTGPVPAPRAEAVAAGPVDESNRIVEVRIEGNHATEVAKLPKLVTRAGQIFDVQTVEEDVRTLHRSRKFVDVRPKTVRVAEGVVVIFQVVERPMLRYVKYVGNERVTTRTLRKKAEIDVGDAMDPYVVEEEIGRAHV